jgi:pyridoxal/pyridoxine/pyridoxamine kinase
MAADSQVIEARGELDPGLYRNLLRPHAPVLIKGVGDRLSGVYYVRSVRTLMQQGELTQTFVAVSNALGRTGQEDFGQSAEEEPAA